MPLCSILKISVQTNMQTNKIQTDNSVLTDLANVLEQRKQAESDSSYVATLYAKGLNKILEKVGEEATETILAAKDYDTSAQDEQKIKELIGETADLWFHTMVMLAKLELRPEQVLDELASRFGLSGLEEKAQRTKPNN